MIAYKYLHEKELMHCYAKTLKNINAKEILKKDGIQCQKDARALAGFFWKLVDQTVIDGKNNLVIAGCKNLESCCEDIMQILRSHFLATGYVEIWEAVSDKA